jgi:hypothetical protein
MFRSSAVSLASAPNAKKKACLSYINSEKLQAYVGPCVTCMTFLSDFSENRKVTNSNTSPKCNISRKTVWWLSLFCTDMAWLMVAFRFAKAKAPAKKIPSRLHYRINTKTHSSSLSIFRSHCRLLYTLFKRNLLRKRTF